MSSLQKTSVGYRIQFRLDKTTRQISLPGAKLRAAELVQRHLDELLSCRRTRSTPHETTLAWTDALDSTLRAELESFGLMSTRPRTGETIAGLFGEFVDFRCHLKPSTLTKYNQTLGKAELYFRSRPLSSLSRADAEDFRRFLLNLKLGENTVRKTCSQMSTFIKWLHRRELWTKANPFDDVPKSVGSAKGSKANVPAETITQTIKEAPDAEWKALIALGRWAGIRVPSEAFALKWEHVTWLPGRIHIQSPKTSHQGKASRVIPMFPELVPYLLTLAESAPKKSEWLFPRLRSKSGQVNEPFRKMIVRAGFKPWPKLWTSLRSTRETELAAVYPLHVVCEWIGNSRAVAQRHYLQVTDSDFEKATRAEDAPKDIASKDGNKRKVRKQKS